VIRFNFAILKPLFLRLVAWHFRDLSIAVKISVTISQEGNSGSSIDSYNTTVTAVGRVFLAHSCSLLSRKYCRDPIVNKFAANPISSAAALAELPDGFRALDPLGFGTRLLPGGGGGN